MERTISKFLFEGQLTSDIYIGANIKNESIKGLACWQKQDGDIPEMYDYVHEKVKYEISVLENVVVRISVKFDYDKSKKFIIGNKQGDKCTIAIDSSLIEVINFFNKSDLDWEIDRVDTGEKTMGILLKGTVDAKIMYSFEADEFGFYQIISFRSICPAHR